ncbi:AP-3 complex subunit beta-2 [Actinomortierella ambigua]|nr:AP-3 complex subunit beta-2 [Actinomortierella ambigua]
MYNVDAYLRTLTSNAAKLSKKVQEGIVENTRDLTFDNEAHFLDTNEDKLRDVSEFFPEVVKNVASNSLEVRKLVYIYILRYAEQEQDLTLLSINTFQKDLGDKNQLIRAMALRVMSGIRVPVISPIVMLGIKKCVTDLSPYVRKIAAHAIPKLYQLDPSQKDALIDVITKLLSDNSTFTIGSVLMAFNEVCPDRYDLIHLHYRKLCRMLVDMDEWGQITAMELLLRYARTQFLNPIGSKASSRPARQQKPKKEKSVVRSFYSDDDSDVSHHSSEASDSSDDDMGGAYMDPDLAFLLKCAQPLLQSRNSQVVLSVAKLYTHLAPPEESLRLARPLVRLLRGHREIQFVVLNNILAIASQRAYIFDQHYQPFFVRATDPVFIQNLKLDILTLIATETNITSILRELQEYVKSPNKEFATKSIKAIGRCAVNIPEMAEGCLGGLLKLVHSTNDSIVSEAVVAIRNLIQERSQDDTALIAQLTKSLDQIKEPNARANVFWLVGQYCGRLATIAPDVLRQGAKSFTTENDNGKLQVLTLGGKLVANKEIEPRNTINMLFQYVLNLARYDLSYDVRDRARFFRSLIYGDQRTASSRLNGQAVEEEGSEEHADHQEDHSAHEAGQNDEGGFEYSIKDLELSDHVRAILLSDKQPPVHENPSNGRENYTMGSMSMVLNRSVAGYEPLPDWPTVQPDPSIRRSAAGLDAPGHLNDRRGFGSDSPHIGGFSSSSSPAFSRSSSAAGSRGTILQTQSLDKFLDSSEEETDSSEEEDESSEDEEATSSEEEGSSEGEEDEDEEEDEEEESAEESSAEETSEEESSDEDLGQSTRARLIGNSEYIQDHDAVFFQEGFDPKPRNLLKELLKKQYPYQTGVVGETMEGWDKTTGGFSKSPIVDNGGAFIASKWPIVFQQQHIYKDACGLERFENKGFVYAKIMYMNKHPIHLINTHLQSDDPTTGYRQWTQVRASQLTEIREFVAQSGIPQDEPIIIGGDLNVNMLGSVGATTPNSENTDAYSEFMRQEYANMVDKHLAVIKPNYTSTADTWDCVENSILGYTSPKVAPMYLDYLFVAKNHAGSVRSFEVETLKVRPETEFQVPKWSCFTRTWTLQDYSDHFPVKATLQVEFQ